MHWKAVLAVFICLLAVAATHGQPPHVAATPPLSPTEEMKALHLPPGFIIQLVAAEPMISKPINIAFDAQGRLWVTESREYPFPAPPGRPTKDDVKILEDFDADGRARKVTTFAGNLNIPIGVLPLSKAAIVFSIPNVYRMRDSDHDGHADQREVLLSTYGHRDTHGLTGEFMLGFDGWVYACHGFANKSEVKTKSTPAIIMESGNTYRFKPDGSRLEHFTHGQVNPFGLAFDPLGNLFSCDCHSRPIYQLLRGACYPSFGRPHDGMGFGPEMVTHDHGSTAIAGISYYAARQFPPEFRDNIFIGNVVTNRINRDRLERHGSTYKGIEMPDLVKSDDPWFRPVDIKLGPDGALYVADFYNRIIGHYEVSLDHPGRDRKRGRIWRIVYRGQDGKQQIPPAPDFTGMTGEQLVTAMGSSNLTVRLFATHELAERRDATPLVRQALATGNPFQRAHALWVLERTGRLEEQALSRAAQDPEAVVRVHAMRVLSGDNGGHFRRLALAGLADSDAFVQRAAAEALGAHPHAENVMPLVQLRWAVPHDDTHLLHAVRLALRDQLVPETLENLRHARLSEKASRALADVCPGLRSPESAAFLLDHLGHWREPGDVLAQYARHIVRHANGDVSRKVLDMVRAADLPTGAAVFRAVVQAEQERGKTLTAEEKSWGEKLTLQLLQSADGNNRQTGIELAGALHLASAQKLLAGFVAEKNGPQVQRQNAAAALLAIAPAPYTPLLAAILEDASEPMEMRAHLAEALGNVNTPEARAKLVAALQSAPARLQRAIALSLAGSRDGAEKLLAAVADGKASARLLQDRPVALRLRQARVPDLGKRLAILTRGLGTPDASVQSLLSKRREGFLAARPDAALGAKVFAKNCAVCHQIKNVGAKIGPQLDGLGMRGLDRILEDVLDPNRNVDQAFRATVLTLKNGQILTGLFLRQEGEILVLADSQGKEARIPRSSVEERSTSPLSPMPANFADQIGEADFYHLLAHLLAQKQQDPSRPR
jgi:putative heme-binding domain-containing protein